MPIHEYNPRPSPERSAQMARVRSSNTKPEMVVRRLIYRLGYRYRLHVAKLPGRPDLVFAGRRKVIFVHGCFWHRHRGCAATRFPKTRRDFWERKFSENVRRDVMAQDALVASGWKFLILWECETRDVGHLEITIRQFLGPCTVPPL